MAEIADRIPGNTIFASYANEIRDRAVMRYLDAPNRDASVPIPLSGDLAWLTTTQAFQIYDGSLWVSLIDAIGTTPYTGILKFFNATADPGGEVSAFNTAGRQILRLDGGDPLDGSGLGARVQLYGQNDSSFPGRFTVNAGPGQEVNFHSDTGTRVTGSPLVLAPPANDAQVALRIEIARPWSFTQVGTGSGTRLRLYSDDNKTLEVGGTTNGTIVLFNNSNYRTAIGSGSASARNILLGTTAPDNAWGDDGDVFIRYLV